MKNYLVTIVHPTNKIPVVYQGLIEAADSETAEATALALYTDGVKPSLIAQVVPNLITHSILRYDLPQCAIERSTLEQFRKALGELDSKRDEVTDLLSTILEIEADAMDAGTFEAEEVLLDLRDSLGELQDNITSTQEGFGWI